MQTIEMNCTHCFRFHRYLALQREQKKNSQTELYAIALIKRKRIPKLNYFLLIAASVQNFVYRIDWTEKALL